MAIQEPTRSIDHTAGGQIHLPQELRTPKTGREFVSASRQLGLNARINPDDKVVVRPPEGCRKVTFANKGGEAFSLSYRALIARAIAALLFLGVLGLVFLPSLRHLIGLV